MLLPNCFQIYVNRIKNYALKFSTQNVKDGVWKKFDDFAHLKYTFKQSYIQHTVKKQIKKGIVIFHNAAFLIQIL